MGTLGWPFPSVTQSGETVYGCYRHGSLTHPMGCPRTLCPILAGRTGCSPHHLFPPSTSTYIPYLDGTSRSAVTPPIIFPPFHGHPVFLKSPLQSCSLTPVAPQNDFVGSSVGESGVVRHALVLTSPCSMPQQHLIHALIPQSRPNEEPPYPQGSMLLRCQAFFV